MPFVALFSMIGGAVKSFFGFKQAQADVVKSAVQTLTSVEATDAQVSQAAATVLSQIMTQGSFLERNWRPTLMILIIIIIGSYYFGYVPPHLNETLSPMMERVFTMLEIGLMGYLPLRSIDKWVNMIQLGSIVKMLVSKRIS
jgi:hypothetical protein